MASSDSFSYDKIHILLLDDRPDGLPRADDPEGPDVPVMLNEFAEWFDFRWLATAEEAAEYRDLSWLIAQQNPQSLGQHGWLPEILLIDYALTQHPEPVAERVADDPEWLWRLSPLPALREVLESSATHSHQSCEIQELEPFPHRPPKGTEYWGCFIGGLLIATFADHPCGPVTITRYDQETLRNHALDALFFESLMATQSGGLLHADGTGSSPSWQDVLPIGIARFRERLASLIRSHIATPSLDDLLAVASDGSHPVLSVTTRFGRRRYPVEALFIEVEPALRAEQANAWARDILDLETIEQLRDGRALADILWNAYHGDALDALFNARVQLSELLVLADDLGGPEHLDDDARSTLARLLDEFGVVDPSKPAGCTQGFCDIRFSPYGSDTNVLRWGMLFVVVQLLELRCAAITADHKRRDQYAELDALPLRAELSKALPLDVDDVLLALFPIAKNPLRLWWHDRDNKNAKSGWTNALKRSGLPAIESILSGEALDAADRFVLRMFAESIGFPADRWQQDPQSRAVLLGEESPE